ncbi:hypothetical protein QFC19_007795 [Naganishia cerealis]|uniref:Uncharacterized protein n=1 Tax=Naganishia cerealis TaxID=610337 RepID=A0ACC2V725_9TREE|nr:hypothetical protein QFC19_007795 [Naganishia cerealis]
MASSCNRCVISASRAAAVQPQRFFAARQLVVASFSTSAIALAGAKKGKPAKSPVKRQGGGFSKAKAGGAQAKQKAEAAALAVRADLIGPEPDLSGLHEFTNDVANEENVGRPTRFVKQRWDSISSFGLPKNIAKEFARDTPTTVVRESTVAVIERITKPTNQSSDSNRILLSGARGCGKSTVMLQAVDSAMQNGSVVIYIPQAINLINSSSPFVYNSASQMFHQPALSAQLLQAMQSTNKSVLSSIKLSQETNIESTAASGGSASFAAGDGLDKLIAAGAKSEALSVPVLEKALDILGSQTDVNVLLAIDEVQALFMTSEYRTPDYTLLESYALSVPRLLLDYISGRKVLARGTVLTSLSFSSPRYLPSLELFTGLSDALPSPVPLTPYDRVNEYHVAHAKGLKVVNVMEKLALGEAQGMMSIWSKKGFVAHRKFAGMWRSYHKKLIAGVHPISATDELFLGKFAESGGNAREFGRGLFSTLAV